MPTYEYLCEKCQKTFEVFQSMKDAPLTECPQDRCQEAEWGRGKVKRLVSGGAGFIFKGSGFYITDYRSESYKEAAKKESAAASGKESGGGKDSGTVAKDSAPKDSPKPSAPKPSAESKSSSSSSSSSGGTA